MDASRCEQHQPYLPQLHQVMEHGVGKTQWRDLMNNNCICLNSTYKYGSNILYVLFFISIIPWRGIIFSAPFFRQRNWCPERLSNLPKTTHYEVVESGCNQTVYRDPSPALDHSCHSISQVWSLLSGHQQSTSSPKNIFWKSLGFFKLKKKLSK